MLRKTAVRVLALVVLAGACASLPLLAQDSQDSQSVAEAARRARQQKQAAAAKPANVITNESLPAAPAGEATAAAPAAAANPTDSAAPAAANGEKPAAGSTEEEEKKNAEIERLKKQIKEKEESVNLAQRELTLEQDNYYSKVDFQHDTEGKQKLDDMRSDLATKQNELADLKAQLAELGATETPKEPPAPATPPGPPGAIKLP